MTYIFSTFGVMCQLFILIPEERMYPELAPYGTAILLAFVFIYLLYFSMVVWQQQTKRLLFRQGFSYKKLSDTHRAFLNKEFRFYQALSPKYQRQFEHRVARFSQDKKFIGREGFQVGDKHRLLISAVACMLSFGRRSYLLPYLETILIYPEAFSSKQNENLHKGEYNPALGVLVLSWADFENGYRIEDDNFNLGLHEFMHVLHVESTKSGNADAHRFSYYFNKISQLLINEDLKKALMESKFFREYGFTNQYELMAVMGEYYFESHQDFKQRFPNLHQDFTHLLNYKTEWLA
ncbi:MAG: zinc-dependent peptidase [Flavobacteriaceae bacterium]|nr:zinc-dependent peptidase [Flavobacteriaceae bacterium]